MPTYAVAAMARDRSCRLFQAYLIGLPLWWALGIDFAMPLLLAASLLLASFEPHQRFTLSDYVLAGIVVVLATTAYVNGFLLSHETMRLVAALYNVSIWLCGLIIFQQVRHILRHRSSRHALLRSGLWAFLVLCSLMWGTFATAYMLDQFHLELPTLFGRVLGHAVPDSAALIQQSTTLSFSRPDWGLPGVAMPRIISLAPYPTASAAIAAVLGTFALLYLQGDRRFGAVAIVMMELIVAVTIALSLTRSIIGGWALGMLVANLIFGSAWRRLAAVGGVMAVGLVVASGSLSSAASYRDYSSESRFENYGYAVERTLTTNPLFGLGIKPREAGNHIAVGSHSTFVSAFTKGGVVALGLVTVCLVLLPAVQWLSATVAQGRGTVSRAELRILFHLQIALWVWLCFEDLDAPATAATLIFIAFAFIEAAIGAVVLKSTGRLPAAMEY